MTPSTTTPQGAEHPRYMLVSDPEGDPLIQRRDGLYLPCPPIDLWYEIAEYFRPQPKWWNGWKDVPEDKRAELLANIADYALDIEWMTAQDVYPNMPVAVLQQGESE